MLPNLRAHVVCSSRQQGASFVQERARSNRALRRSGAMAVCTAAGGSAQDMQTMAERSGSGSIGHLFSPGPLQARSPSPPFSGESEHLKVFMMLPLDTVNADGLFRYAAVPWFSQALHLLAASGVHGVAVDVWWGTVEREPRQYHWQPYRQLFELVKSVGLKLQVVLSFHACGGNVGDTAQIPLPKWVLEAGEADPDIFFTDRPRGHGRLGQRNREYLSIWADEVPGVLAGRSPIECYTDFMAAFKAAFYTDLGSLVEEVVVGSGPCGELRLPSYVESNGWRFPGVGEFQCYDRHALASLAAAAHRVGKPEWGYTGPHDAGHYTSYPEHTGFFSTGGSWDTPYGRFFLDWYSGSLLKHGERLLSAASQVFAWHPAQDLVHLGLLSSGCAGTGSGAVPGSGLGGSGGLGLGGASGASGSGAGGLMRSLASLGCRGPFSGSHAFMSSRMSYAGSTSLGGQPLLSPIRQEQRQQQQQQAARTAAAAAEPQQQQQQQQERTQQDSPTLLQQPQQQTQQLQQVQQQQQQQQPAVPAQQPRTSGSGGSGSGGGGLLQSLAAMAAALPGPLRAAAMHHLNKSLGGGSGSGGRNSGVSSSGSSSKSNYEGDMLASGDTCTAEMQLDPDVVGAVRIRSTSGGTAMEGSEASLSVGSANTHSTASTAATTTTTTTASPMHRSSSQNCQPASPLGGTTAGSTSNSDPFTSHSSLNLDAFSTGGTASSQPGHHHQNHEHHHEHYNERHHEGDREKDAAGGMPAMVAMYGDVANALVGGEDGGSQGSIAGSIIGSDVGVSCSGSGTQGDLAALGSQRVGRSSNGGADADDLDADLDSLGPMVCRGGSNPRLMAGALGAAPGRQRWPDSNSGSGGGPLATMQQHLAQLVQRASGSSNGAAGAGEARPSLAASQQQQQQQQQQLDSSETAAQLDAAALSGLGNALGGLLSGVAGLGVGGINALGLGGSGAPPRGASCPELTHAAALAAAAAAAAAAANNNGSVSSPGLSLPPSGPNGSGGTISNNAMLGSFGAGAAAFPAYGGGGGPVALTLKIAGIHWWYHTSSHAAELTAGYYNAGSVDGYAAIVELCARHRVSLILTCVEMCDAQHPPDAACGPEGLLKQVRSLAARAGVPLGGENALPIFLANGIDATALERIVANTQASPTQPSGLAASLGAGGQLQQHQALYGGGGNGNCAGIGSALLHSAPPSLLMSSSSFGGNMALGASTYSAGGGGGMGAGNGLQMGDVARSGSFGRASSCGQASPANSVSMLLGGQLGSLGSMFNALTGGVGGGGNGNNNTGSGYLPAGSNANACLPSNGSLTRISGEYTQFSAAAIANGGSVVCGGAGHRTPSFSSSPARNNIVALPRCVSLFQQTSLQQLGQLGGQLGQQQQLPATALSDGAGPQSGGNSAWDCYSGMVSMPLPVASGAGTSSAAAAAGLHGGYYYPGGVVASSGISGVGIISGNNGGGGAAGVNGLTSPRPAGNGLWQQQLQQQALYYQYASHHPNGCGSAGNLGCSSAGGPGGGGSGSGGGSNGGPGLAYGPGQYPGLRCFTFLRLGPEILQPHYQAMWVKFMHSLARNSSNAVAAARMGGGGGGCMPGGGGGMYGGAYGGSGRIHTTLQ